MTKRPMFKFRILGLFRMFCRNMAAWSGLALTSQPSAHPLGFPSQPHVYPVCPSGLELKAHKHPSPCAQTLSTLVTDSHHSLTPLGVHLLSRKDGPGELAYVDHLGRDF